MITVMIAPIRPRVTSAVFDTMPASPASVDGSQLWRVRSARPLPGPCLSPLALLPLLVLVLGLTACGDDTRGTQPGAGPSPRRVIVLGIDGLDPDVTRDLIAEGKLPHLKRLIDDGASGIMESPPPLLSPVIWTTLATGRRPSEHGIGHFTTLDPVTGEELPVTSTLRRTHALWTIVSDAGRRVAVVGWWATWPTEEVKGVIVSDRAGYHFLMGDRLTDAGAEDGVVWPAGRQSELLAKMRRPETLGAQEIAPFATVSPEELERPFSFEDDLGQLRWALATATSYRDLGLELWRRDRPDLLMVYIEAVDSLSHLFGHLYRQEGLAGELAEQQRRFGGAVEAVYELADETIGKYLAEMDQQTTLVVVSDHGFQLGELLEDPTKSRDLRRVSEEYHRTAASLFFYGSGVRPGTTWERATTLDLTPTLLALAGLPAANDMPGRVLDEVLDLQVPERRESYENPDATTAIADRANGSEVDAAVIERLRSLGYLGDEREPPTKNQRNLASLMLREGKYRDAALAFKSLIDSDPDDAALHTGLATALAQLGRHRQALNEYDRAVELDPLFIPARFNRGLLYERLGDHDAAITDYRTALRYDADHAPSRRALIRLGVAPNDRTATSDAEIRAQGLLREARDLAQRGDYEAADERLKEAQALVPDAAVVYQYRANIAYLTGDTGAAIEYLRRAVELEPNNSLLQQNLHRLESREQTP